MAKAPAHGGVVDWDKLREVAEAIVKAAGGGNVETHFK